MKRGLRIVHGDKELVEKLGRSDPCPCGSGRRFQGVLPQFGQLSSTATTMCAEDSIDEGLRRQVLVNGDVMHDEDGRRFRWRDPYLPVAGRPRDDLHLIGEMTDRSKHRGWTELAKVKTPGQVHRSFRELLKSEDEALIDSTARKRMPG